MPSSSSKKEKRVLVEQIWDEILHAQMEKGKIVKLIGSAELAAWVGGIFRRKESTDVDIAVPGKAEGLQAYKLFRERLNTKIDVSQTYFHPLYGKLCCLREKDVQDLMSVYKTYCLLKKRSEDASELYLEDLSHALAKSMREEFGKRIYSPFGWWSVRRSIPVIYYSLKKRGAHELSGFFLELMKRAAKYLPEQWAAEVKDGLRNLREVRRDVM